MGYSRGAPMPSWGERRDYSQQSKNVADKRHRYQDQESYDRRICGQWRVANDAVPLLDKQGLERPGVEIRRNKAETYVKLGKLNAVLNNKQELIAVQQK